MSTSPAGYTTERAGPIAMTLAEAVERIAHEDGHLFDTRKNRYCSSYGDRCDEGGGEHGPDCGPEHAWGCDCGWADAIRVLRLAASPAAQEPPGGEYLACGYLLSDHRHVAADSLDVERAVWLAYAVAIHGDEHVPPSCDSCDDGTQRVLARLRSPEPAV